VSVAVPSQGTGGLLRIATAGSVDDGKSTLIGRLLFDSKQIFEDQLEQVAQASERRHGADGEVDLALLTDGLRAEREQGITIDVAYRYFATPRRTFIMADTPGHVRYTRNMVTGASTADLALVLIDARNGIVQQSRRHAFIASLLRIPHIVVCINKMDLVDWSEEVYNRIADEFTDFAARLEVSDVSFIPISALKGDNVVDRSENMPWYGGSPLLYHLEHVHIASDRNLIDVRFPVQWVVRPGTDEHHDYRGYAGQVASGVLRAGDDVQNARTRKNEKIARLFAVHANRRERIERAGAGGIVVAMGLRDAGTGDTLVAGDFLFCRAFALCARFEAEVIRWAAEACVALTEGEILQGRFRRNPAVTVADYVEIIDRKTAALFAAGSRTAHVARHTTSQPHAG
jgi:sulfate adenylyltransferase large subunit